MKTLKTYQLPQQTQELLTDLRDFQLQGISVNTEGLFLEPTDKVYSSLPYPLEGSASIKTHYRVFYGEVTDLETYSAQLIQDHDNSYCLRCFNKSVTINEWEKRVKL